MKRIMRLHQQEKLLPAAALNGVEAKLTKIDMKFLLGFGCDSNRAIDIRPEQSGHKINTFSLFYKTRLTAMTNSILN